MVICVLFGRDLPVTSHRFSMHAADDILPRHRHFQKPRYLRILSGICAILLLKMLSVDAHDMYAQTYVTGLKFQRGKMRCFDVHLSSASAAVFPRSILLCSHPLADILGLQRSTILANLSNKYSFSLKFKHGMVSQRHLTSN